MPKSKRKKRHTIALLNHRVAILEARLVREAQRADANFRDAERAKYTLDRYRARTEHVLLWMGDKLEELHLAPVGISSRVPRPVRTT